MIFYEILNIKTFSREEGDKLYIRERFNSKGRLSIYGILKTARDVNDKNLTKIGESKKFSLWMDKYTPPEGY